MHTDIRRGGRAVVRREGCSGRGGGGGGGRHQRWVWRAGQACRGVRSHQHRRWRKREHVGEKRGDPSYHGALRGRGQNKEGRTGLEEKSGGKSGIMGCFHSKNVSPRKNTGPDTQPRGTPTPQDESEVHPEIVQLAEVSSGLCMMMV